MRGKNRPIAYKNLKNWICKHKFWLCCIQDVMKLSCKTSGMDSSCKEKEKVNYNIGPEMLNYRVIRLFINGSAGLQFEILVAIVA